MIEKIFTSRLFWKFVGETSVYTGIYVALSWMAPGHPWWHQTLAAILPMLANVGGHGEGLYRR